MSSTGFFHSRRFGTVGDAGCWAFVLGVFVIHPPNETQLQSQIAVHRGPWVRLLLAPAMQVFPALAVRETDCPRYYLNKVAVVRTTPVIPGIPPLLSGQSFEPSIRYYVKCWPSNTNPHRILSRMQILERRTDALLLRSAPVTLTSMRTAPSAGECTFRGMYGATAE
jgi:hypothetical protein